jgi:nitrite reductase/ring-hydroxylating ferredoxin subunit
MPVNLEFSIVAAAPQLSALGGFAEFIVPQNVSQYLGYGGIVVVHTYENKYCAFDMSCPVEAEANVRVYTDFTGVATCEKCGAEYLLIDGNAFPQKGNSKFTLKKYSVYYNELYNSIYVTR